MNEAIDLVLEFAGEKVGVAIHGGHNGDVDLSDYAPLDSPDFEGEPTAPTPETDDYGKRIATTEYVTEKLAGVVVEGGGMLPGNVDPLEPGEATPGKSNLAARQDHVHPVQENISGNAGTATKLQNARTISLTGGVSGSASFDGSENITITTVGNGVGGEPGGPVDWQDVQNKPPTFPPSTHSHTDYADRSHRHQAEEIDGLSDGVALGTTPGLGATASGTAGTSEFAARNDHTHPLQTTVSGNAGSATKLQAARTISLTGDCSGSASFDGSQNISIVATVTNGGIQLGDTLPNGAGNAAPGTASTAARIDHVHPLQTTVSGNAGTATKLATSRTIALSGAVSGSGSFDGSGNLSITTTSNISTVSLGSTVGTSHGTASAGTASTAARSDHVHPLQTTVSGNAGSATQLQTARTIALSGGAVGTATSFNGTSNITIPVTSLDATKLSGTASVNTSGNAGSATKLATARTITISGVVSGSASFDGSSNITISTTGGGVSLGSTAGLGHTTNGSAGTATTAARSDHTHPEKRVVLTQAQYNALSTKDSNTLYLIPE